MKINIYYYLIPVKSVHVGLRLGFLGPIVSEWQINCMPAE